MKKKIAFLFAALMLVLAGCGAKVNDHVVDYHIDLPDGFEETELEGADACWFNAADLSNVNLLISDKAAGADAAFKLASADILRETVKETLAAQYGDTEITDRFFTKNDVCGLAAYQYGYSATVSGVNVYQIIVCINADKTYTFTYTTSDDSTFAAFQESARNIQLTIE